MSNDTISDRERFSKGSAYMVSILAMYICIVPPILLVSALLFAINAPYNLLLSIWVLPRYILANLRAQKIYGSDVYINFNYLLIMQRQKIRRITIMIEILSYYLVTLNFGLALIISGCLALGLAIPTTITSVSLMLIAALSFDLLRLLPRRINPVEKIISFSLRFEGISRFFTKTNTLSTTAFNVIKRYLDNHSSKSRLEKFAKGQNPELAAAVNNSAANPNQKALKLLLSYPEIQICLNKDLYQSLNLRKHKITPDYAFFKQAFKLEQITKKFYPYITLRHIFDRLATCPEPKTAPSKKDLLCAKLIQQIKSHASKEETGLTLDKIVQLEIRKISNVYVLLNWVSPELLDLFEIEYDELQVPDISAICSVAAVLTVEGFAEEALDLLCNETEYIFYNEWGLREEISNILRDKIVPAVKQRFCAPNAAPNTSPRNSSASHSASADGVTNNNFHPFRARQNSTPAPWSKNNVQQQTHEAPVERRRNSCSI